ncbi:rhomboid family intramembrane serine protease [Pararhizobium mangrovi]|uniref:Rhomboid family intramembrane serine protease n=1 Tax=Pararhizobium mangrovi TaxID=2590452 RepID=A0A506UEP2_9HYPH|nr:rhomboid family intramembrane serine protease [Pararhizobium mangrovi]TPW31239.1 rhomboid family intramembrane serine protease [Pararhizobium mangrovi]
MRDRTEPPEPPRPAYSAQYGRPPREPMFNVPPVLTWFLAALWLVHLARVYVLTAAQNQAFLLQTAFIPIRYATPLDQQSTAWLWSPLTYAFLHGSFVHIFVNSIWLVAFGAVVARRLGPARFTIFWLAASVVSAFAFLALNWAEPVPVIGASGVVSGLMGAAARFAFPRSGPFRRENAHFLPRVGIVEALRNRTVLAYVVIWFAINLLTAVGFSPGTGAGVAVAWQAHVGGFLLGFLCFGAFDRRHWT